MTVLRTGRAFASLHEGQLLSQGTEVFMTQRRRHLGTAIAMGALAFTLSVAVSAQPAATSTTDSASSSPPAPLERGDAAWARRGDGQSNGLAAAAPIAEAVAAYEAALTAEPSNLEARARLLRALWFQGQYATADDAGKQKVFERGKTVGEQGLDQIAASAKKTRSAIDEGSAQAVAEAVRPIPGAAPIFFWSAVHWGLWGDAFGKFAAARQGVAGKIRDRCLVVLALDENLERGGGHRVLGRLHAVAPHVPFFTGWIDRTTAIAELRKALALGPEDPLNRQYLGEALLEYGDAAGRGEARNILQAIVDHALVPEQAVEWSAAQAVARELLGTAR